MSWNCGRCDESFESRKALSRHLQTHAEGEEKEITITIDNLRETTTSRGGINYQIWSDNDEMYSTFDEPAQWEELRQGDKILLRFIQKGNYKNLVEGSIEILETSDQPKQQRRTERAQPSRGNGGPTFSTKELAVKWVLEATSRTLQNQEEITEEGLNMVLQHYATYARTELSPLEREEESKEDKEKD